MACCPCCCTKQNGVCCGTGEEKVCCKAPRECCTVYEIGVGESDVCCTETQYCCNDGQGVCCEVGEVCCVGDEGAVCCESNVVCCAGVCCAEGECCVDDACVPCDCESDEDCPEGECCNDGVCGECGCDTDEDCGYCVGLLGLAQGYVATCEEMQTLCDQLGGVYTSIGTPPVETCACLVEIPTDNNDCSALEEQYNSPFTLEAGHCCDNQCQYEPCDESPP